MIVCGGRPVGGQIAFEKKVALAATSHRLGWLRPV